MATATTNMIQPNLGIIGKKPDKVTIIANPGEENAESFTVLLNPQRLRESIQVEWAKLPVVGLDYEVIHYSRTRSIELPMSFHFSIFEKARQQIGGTPDPQAQITQMVGSGAVTSSALASASTDFVNFLRSLCFPTIAGLRPPTVKVIWPNVVSFLAVVSRVDFEYMKFDRTLAPIVYQAEVTFLETRVSRRYSEDARVNGLTSPTDPNTPQGI